VAVRRASYGDEQTLRSLRLQAMTDAPDAFGSTYEREKARTASDWQRWIEPNPTFLFELPSDEAVGIVAAVTDPAEPTVVQLMSMWVHPSVRGTGVGDALVQAVIAWATVEHALALRVWVMQGNISAVRLYERNGFRTTGNTAVRDRDGAVEVEMHRP
jgi:GNAT superfamily N-acetyltransferase